MSAPVSFFDVVSARQQTLNTLLCVGLDPDVSKIPSGIRLLRGRF